MDTIKLAPEDKISIIKEVLLNKIEGLKWYYFDIDLEHKIYDDTKWIEDDTFFAGISLHTKTYNGELAGKKELYKTAVENILGVAHGKEFIFAEVAKRIFSLGVILNESDAEKGLMGKFNDKDRKRRNDHYLELIGEGFREDPNHIVVMAEGDSWFEFPRVYLKIDAVKDILDWLIEDDNYAVYSLASGGDWLSNMLYLGEYIEDLPKVSPDVFLISGGGNDLVGNHRLATMVINPAIEGKRDVAKTKHLAQLFELRKDSLKTKENKDKYQLGLSLIADEFLQFLNLVLVQYFLFLNNITRVPAYKNMLILTHGYDFAIPSSKKHGNWLSMQRILNEFTDTGKWLYEALAMKGITKSEDQEAVVYTMIYEFNEVMIKLANYFPTVFHIDCRGVAGPDDWFDELHLKSDKFEAVAATYKKCIADNRQRIKEKADSSKIEKVYRVLDMQPKP